MSDDETALTAYLRRAVDETVVGVESLAVGLNRHYLVATESDPRAYVVRMPQKLRDSYYMNGVADEYAVLERLESAPFDTPEPVALCRDSSVLGVPFFVTTHLSGQEVSLGDRLPEQRQQPTVRRAVGERLIDTLAAIHGCEPARFVDCCDRRPPRAGIERLRDRLEEATLPAELHSRLQTLGGWLARAAPDEGDSRLCHGDFRPGNVLFTDGDPIAVGGVIDWETAWLGDPLTELGYLLVRWRDEGDPTPTVSGFDTLEAAANPERVRTTLQRRNEAGFAPFTSQPGSPTRRELVERYETTTDRSFHDDRFYRALTAWELAAVWVDLYQLDPPGESDRLPYVEYATRLAELIREGALSL